MSKPKRKPAGFWRELIMLREKGVFRSCYNEDLLIGTVVSTLGGFAFAFFLVAVISIGNQLAFFLKGMSVIMICLFITFSSFVVVPVLASWKSILRPAYYRRKLADARAEFILAMQDLEASLPSTHYRVASTENLPTSTERLRAYAENNRLSEDQRSKLAKVEASKEKVQEAEQELDRIAPNVGRWVTS